MQSGWRLYGVMILLAALTGTVVALTLSGGPRFPSESPRASGSSTASPSASASRSPASQISATPTASPSPSATPSDPLQRVKPLVFAWRPAATTAITSEQGAGAFRVVAVPLDGSAATPLLDLPDATQWTMRLDGSAIAMTLDVGGRTRVAALNLQSGALGWVTPDEPSVSQVSPLWSNDGTVIYYTRTSLDGRADEGIYRIRVDGSNLTQLRAPSSDGAIKVVGITPDGLGLVIDRALVSGLVDILDLNTRAIRSYAQVQPATGEHASGAVNAWRAQRPRALVVISQPAGGPHLYVWDDLLAQQANVQPVAPMNVLEADWDPTATKIVAAIDVSTSSGEAGPRTLARLPASARWALATMDSNGQNRVTLNGTDGAMRALWLRAGVVYLYSAPGGSATEIRIAQPAGTAAPRTLYTASTLLSLTYVTP